MNKIFELFQRRYEYAPPDQQVIESLHKESLTLQSFESMKSTDGWKILDNKLREELRKAIFDKVKDDIKIKVLLDLLSTVETKDAMKLLADEIERVIPT